LIWLDNHQLTLATLTQSSLEDWLAANPTRQRYLQPFIAWTNRRRLTQGLVVPTAPRPEPHLFLTEHDRTDQLHRCLHDENMPIEGRVAGTLLLLFGIPVSRLTQLTLDDFNNGALLRIGTHCLQLPPRVADLLTRLVEHPRPTRSTLAKLAPNRWLFPRHQPNPPSQPKSAHRHAAPQWHQRHRWPQHRPRRVGLATTHVRAGRPHRHPHPHRRRVEPPGRKRLDTVRGAASRGWPDQYQGRALTHRGRSGYGSSDTWIMVDEIRHLPVLVIDGARFADFDGFAREFSRLLCTTRGRETWMPSTICYEGVSGRPRTDGC